MKYRAIFIDVDGTLLTDKLEISRATREAIGWIHRMGVLVVIVTARSPGASLFLYDELGISNNPIVCFNGALIVRENTILHDQQVETSDLKNIVHLLNDFDINISVYKHHDWFAEKIDKWIEQESAITHSVINRIDFAELLENEFCANKLLCMGEPEEIDRAEKYLKHSGFEHLNIHKSKTTYLEITNLNASKKQGVQKLLDVYEFNPQQIIAIGDNFNDIDMLQFSGTSVVMGNAPEEVKQVATFVTDTNNNDGIAKALERLFGDK
ncbi:Cof-type HAD-IIB family hydrolase [Danxiaibacter flavus]|uniref:Cof-type HAD-IIB family hydrolase n=1 Tax=Danxiaibacter flavus TaxID=3049108 RepID=A0ABV3ZI87_9BACT|nr:Cof-type HAD-IIB family hydrolase [Chitinophagaceae bacterium DXS]